MIGIVGAGITGLTTSFYLDRLGVEHVVLEASDEPGGVVRSGRVEGRVLEYGPQRTRATGPLLELVEALDLEDALVEGDPTLPMYVYAAGRLRRAPFSVGTFLTTDLLSWRAKLRVLAEPLTAPGTPEESAAELFVRKFGLGAYENFIGPLFGGIYGSDPARMPAGHAPSPLLALERRSGSLLWPAIRTALENTRTPPISFAEGMGQLPRALYRATESAVHLGRSVRAIEERGTGYVLRTDDDSFPVDSVVLTTPADVTATLLESTDSDAADRLRRLRYNPLAIVHLAAETDVEGFGYQVGRTEGLRTLGVSWNAGLFDRDDVYTCFLGGMDDPLLVDAPDATVEDVAVEEFRAVMGADPTVLDVTTLRRGFPAWDYSWTALEGLRTPDDVHLATNYTGRMGIPARVADGKRLASRLAG